MEASQKLNIIATIFSGIAIYCLYWFTATINAPGEETYYVSGINFFFNIYPILADPNGFALDSGSALFVSYGLLAIAAILIITPVVQFLGYYNKNVALVGCIVPLVTGIFIILYGQFGLFGAYIKPLSMIFGETSPLRLESFPIAYNLRDRFEYIGTYIMIAGGAFSLIAYLKARSEA